MFDAIETGRQWETIAQEQRAWEDEHTGPSICSAHQFRVRGCPQCAAIRDVADRTPGPHHDGGVGA